MYEQDRILSAGPLLQVPRVIPSMPIGFQLVLKNQWRMRVQNGTRPAMHNHGCVNGLQQGQQADCALEGVCLMRQAVAEAASRTGSLNLFGDLGRV